MREEVKYRIIFPEQVFEAVHANQAIKDACDYFKKHTIEVEWVQVHD